MSTSSGPVTEAQATASIIVDPECFVCRFTDVIYQVSDVHSFYAILSAYAALATTAPPNLVLQGLGGKTLANFWTILVGPSGDRKSHVVGIAKDLLATANPALVGSGEPGSEEAFFTQVAAYPTQMWAMLEMGKFLASAQRNSYLAKIKPTMTDLFDGRTQTRVLRKETYTIVNPRISILAAITPRFLDMYSAPDDWEGGFLSRFAFGWAERERTRHIDIVNSDVEAVWYPALAMKLSWLMQQKAAPCIGFEDDALRFWVDWAEDFGRRTQPLARQLSGQRERAYLQARKFMLLNAWDTGLARSGQPWKMRLYEMAPATRLAELCFNSAAALSYLATDSKDVRDRRAVLSTLGNDWVADSLIARSVPEVGLQKRLGDVLASLDHERLIAKKSVNGQTFYRRMTTEETESGVPVLEALHAPHDLAMNGRANGAPSGQGEAFGQILPFPGADQTTAESTGAPGPK